LSLHSLARLFTATLFIFASSFSSRADGNGGPPEEAVGERLFLETRFSQFFAAHSAAMPTLRWPRAIQ